MLVGVIGGFKDRGLVPAKISPAEASDFANGRAAELYGLYQARLKTLNAVDFGDLLLHMLTIFREHDDILRDYQSRLTYIMVDEYQDTNVCLLYTSPSPRDRSLSRMPSSA